MAERNGKSSGFLLIFFFFETEYPYVTGTHWWFGTHGVAQAVLTLTIFLSASAVLEL
jgi:hypothetical protein